MKETENKIKKGNLAKKSRPNRKKSPYNHSKSGSDAVSQNKAKIDKPKVNSWIRKPYKLTTKKKKEFLRLVREDGMKRTNAILEVGISRATLADHLNREPDFRDALDQAEMDQEKNHIEKVEDALFDAAESGNVTAIQVFLYNRHPEKWADKRNIQLTGKNDGPIKFDATLDIKNKIIKSLTGQPEARKKVAEALLSVSESKS